MEVDNLENENVQQKGELTWKRCVLYSLDVDEFGNNRNCRVLILTFSHLEDLQHSSNKGINELRYHSVVKARLDRVLLPAYSAAWAVCLCLESKFVMYLVCTVAERVDLFYIVVEYSRAVAFSAIIPPTICVASGASKFEFRREDCSAKSVVELSLSLCPKSESGN